jgi:hypothetical protein
MGYYYGYLRLPTGLWTASREGWGMGHTTTATTTAKTMATATAAMTADCCQDPEQEKANLDPDP